MENTQKVNAMNKFQQYVEQEFKKALKPSDIYGGDAVDELLESHDCELIRWVHQAWVSKVGEEFYLSPQCGDCSKTRFERFIADIPILTERDLRRVMDKEDIEKVLDFE